MIVRPPSSLRCIASLALLGCSVTALGCGRFGYDTVTLSANDGGLDGASDAMIDGATTPGFDGAIPPPPTCATNPTAILCASFDDATGFRTIANADGQIGIVSGVLDVTTTAPGGAAYYIATFPAITSGQLYFRGSMRIVGSNVITGVNPFMIGTDSSDDFGLDFNLVNGGQFEVYPSTGVGTVVSSAIMPRDQWLCFQGQITVGDGTTGAISVTADGAALVSMGGIDTLPPTGITDLRIGIDYTAPGQANMRIQWDSFALARSPIACP